MAKLLTLSRIIDFINRHLFSLVSYFSLFMVIVQFVVVILRYVFGIGFVMLQESILYMHAFLFLFTVSGTYIANEHIRVDIFFQGFSDTKKAWVDLLGCLFLIVPFSVLILYTSRKYVLNSWKTLEGSREVSGIQGVYLLKTAIPLFAFFLLLQAISQIIKAYHQLKMKQKH